MNDKQILEQLDQEISQWQPDCWAAIYEAPTDRIAPLPIQVVSSKRTKTWTKTVVACAAMLFLFFGGTACYLTPLTYIALDINPSIELQTNMFDRVIAVHPVNAEGEQIVIALTLKHKSMDQATQEIVDAAIVQGYLSQQQRGNAIMIAVDTNRAERQVVIQDSLAKTVDHCLAQQAVSAQVLSHDIQHNPQNQMAAHQLGISESKMLLIEEIRAKDPSVAVENLHHKSIGQIVKYAKGKKLTLDILDDWEDDDWDDDDWEDDGWEDDDWDDADFNNHDHHEKKHDFKKAQKQQAKEAKNRPVPNNSATQQMSDDDWDDDDLDDLDDNNDDDDNKDNNDDFNDDDNDNDD